MTTPNPKVNWYFAKAKNWKEETELLRKIVLSCELNEVLKYGCPAYTINDKSIVLMHTFKDYCALLFYKGAIMKDPKKILIQQTKNVQSARQLRFTSLSQIQKMENTIKTYIKVAIQVEKSGAKVPMKQTEQYAVPTELVNAFDSSPKLKEAFDKLTPGRQRGYLLYFSSAKQAQTRIERIKKCTPAMLQGKGIMMNKKLES
jgi:uncharacterized protein YdeI (YjbR/CyaY-like superfamily)